MTDRLQLIEDREAIRQVFTDYATRLDGSDYEGFARLFSKSGVFGEARGIAAIEENVRQYGERVEGARAEGRFRTAVHVMTNHDIRLDGDRATAKVMWSYLVQNEDALPTVLQAGYYNDELVREDGAWKIAHHRIERFMGRGQLEPPHQPTRTEMLEARLREAEDRLEIAELCVRVSDCLDARDLEGYGNGFTEDGEWSGIIGRATGPKAIAELLGQYLKPWESDAVRSYHTTDDVVIELHGDTAKATCKWQHIIRMEADEPKIWHLGYYDDRLRRTPAGWRFTRRAAYAAIPYYEPKHQLPGMPEGDPPLFR